MNAAHYEELFRLEAREHLAELDAALLALEQGTAGGAVRDGHLATIFRGTHTIKGMAAAMGFRSVEQVAHALESLMDEVRAGRRSLSGETLALLFDGTAVLALTVADATDGRAEMERDETRALLARLDEANRRAPGDPARRVMGSVAAIAESIAGGIPLAIPGFDDMLDAAQGAVVEAPSAASPPMPHQLVEIRLRPDCPLKGVRAMLVLARLQTCGTVQETEPGQARWQDEAFAGAFTVVLESDASPADIEAAAMSAGEVERVVVGAPRAPQGTGDDASSIAARDVVRYVRIDQRRLDTLVDLMGELVITRDRLLRQAEQAVERGADRALLGDAHETARLVSALQDEVLQARMVPVGQVFDRFPRLVRDIARELGKEVQFVTEGREIELDRSLLDAIGDPILHLLRNALDHGLEDAAARRAAGKPPTGRLVLRAARDRASIVIQVEDDGRGIDRRAVLRRATERGLATMHETEQAIDDDRLLQLLAHAGLSTAPAVTSISGRGVGVDVVATRVRALGGFLALETIEGVGTVFTMRLPVTLAIMRALLVQVAGEIYALPTAHVVEALEYDPAQRVQRDGREGLALRDETLPVLRMRERFGLEREPRQGEDGYVAVVEVAGRRTALLVDALVAQQDIVVKPLHAARGGMPWFTGATVLGDGTPSLIVDLGGLT